ncbi:hypothetical protein AAG906_026167 [Vitis piasezkii]
MTDGVVPHDEYHDEMDMLGISQFLDIDQIIAAPELSAFVIPIIDMYEGTVGPIEERPIVDPPLSFDILSLQVKEEIQKQLSVGFISVVEYPEWLANVVPVPKKDGKVRVCVDFRDLNKANPKDDFPLPHIDLLVDCTAGHSMLLRLNPKKCTFGVTSGKLLGHMVSERGIEVDPDKIKAILDMPVPRTEKEIRGFLGRLQYISRFIARLTDICEPIFRLLRKNQPTVWNDDCQLAFERIKEYLLSPPVLVPPMPGRPLLLYLASTWPWASLPIIKSRPIDDDFPDEEFVAMTRQVRGDWKTRDVKLKPYHAYLELLIEKFEELKYIHLPRAHNQFADALATLASTVDIPTNVVVRPLLIETRSAPAYCHLIDETEVQDDLPWFHDICQFLRFGTYPEAATAKDRRALRSSDDRGSCRSLWSLYGWTHVNPVSDAWGSYSCTTLRVACFDIAMAILSMGSHIICRYGVPHELISDRGAHFRAEVETLLQKYGIQHHRSSAYRPQTNGLPFALWAYRTSFRTPTEATPYSLVYGMEAVLPIETEMGSLRVALEQQISETEWAQARFDQLNLLDERRLRAADHVQAYQRKMARAFKKRVKPRPLYKGDLVLRMLRGLIGDPRGKFRPNWSGPYVIRELTPEGAAWLTDLDGNQFLEPTNVDQLKKYYV